MRMMFLKVSPRQNSNIKCLNICLKPLKLNQTVKTKKKRPVLKSNKNHAMAMTTVACRK